MADKAKAADGDGKRVKLPGINKTNSHNKANANTIDATPDDEGVEPSKLTVETEEDYWTRRRLRGAALCGSLSSHFKAEAEYEHGEGETGTSRKKMKRFQLPDVPRWWQAKVIQYAFAHPHVRARLEKLMGTNLVRLTDKIYMNDLEDRIREVYEENLDKRIRERVMDEKERLKRLILVGKTPLKQCPPELYHHPVFVFWRMVNKEVARESKKRADAYYRKLQASQKMDQATDDNELVEATEEVTETLSPTQLLTKCHDEIEQQKLLDIERGVRFTDDQFALLKFETPDVKLLKSLQTVDELYALADKIIGTKRL